MVIAASLSLADIPGMVRLWRQRKSDFWLAMAAFLGVALLGVLPGIGHRRGAVDPQRLPAGVAAVPGRLGRVTGIAGYHDIDGYPEAAQLPGLVIFRFDSPLFFANANDLPRRDPANSADADPRPTWIVVAAEPITDIDTTAADMLEELDEELNAQDASLVFAELKYPVRRRSNATS